MNTENKHSQRLHEESEFEVFLAANDSAPAPEELKKRLGVVTKDLVSSKFWLGFSFVVLNIVGYVLSLSICEQHNIGLFLVSHQVAGALSQLPNLWCAATCGLLFTGIPTLFYRLFMNRFRQRFLLSRLWWLAVSAPLLAITCLLLFSQESGGGGLSHEAMHMSLRDHMWMMVWLTSALLTPYLFDTVIYRMILRARPSTSRKKTNATERAENHCAAPRAIHRRLPLL